MYEPISTCVTVCGQAWYLNIYIVGIVLTLVLIVIRLAIRQRKNKLIKHLFTAFIVLFFFTFAVGGLYDDCTRCGITKTQFETKLFPTDLIPFIDPDSATNYLYSF